MRASLTLRPHHNLITDLDLFVDDTMAPSSFLLLLPGELRISESHS